MQGKLLLLLLVVVMELTALMDSTDKPGQKIQFDFTKKEVPHRPRAGSSPIRNAPQVMVTSSSLSKNRTHRLRGGSHGDVDFKSATTSIDYDAVPGADEELLSSGIMRDRGLHSEIMSKLRSSPNSSLPHDHGFDTGDETDASSTLSSDFMPTADSNPDVIGNSLSLPPRTVQRTSPAILNALPPPIRPVSVMQPVSLLSKLLKSAEAESPMDAYKFFDGKGELAPVYLRIYIPFRGSGVEPFEIVLSRFAKEDGSGKNRETTVAEAIGFVLYKYIEEKKSPSLQDEQLDINRWVFRMVDEGEPDDDFPPLERTQPITSYMTKKAARGGRLAQQKEVKLEGEFALCKATEEQCEIAPLLLPIRLRSSHLCIRCPAL